MSILDGIEFTAVRFSLYMPVDFASTTSGIVVPIDCRGSSFIARGMPSLDKLDRPIAAVPGKVRAS